MNGVAGAGLPAEIWRDFARYAMSKGVVRANGRQIGLAPVAPPPVVEPELLDVPPAEVAPVEGAEPAAPEAAPAAPVAPSPAPQGPQPIF
jgi:hypothetical protein